MPLHIDANLVVPLQSPEVLSVLEAPEPNLPFGVTDPDELPVWASSHSTRVALRLVATQCLLLVWLETVDAVVDKQLIISTRANPVTALMDQG